MNTSRCNFMPQVMMAPDMDSAGGSGSSDTGDDNQFSYNPDINSDAMATTLDSVVEAPAHEYMASDSDEEVVDNLQGEDDSVLNNDSDDDPDSIADDNVEDDDDPALDTEENDEDVLPQTPNIATVLRAGKLGFSEEKIQELIGLGAGVLEAVISDMPDTQAGNQQSGDQQQASEYKAPEAYVHELGEDHDEDAIKAFSGMSEHVNTQMNDVHGLLGGLTQMVQNNAYDQLDAQVNELIDELKDFKGAAFNNTLGAGTDGIVASNSIAARNRQSVMKEMNSLQEKRIANNQPPMTTKRAFNRAVKTVTGTDINSTNKKTVAKLGKRSQSNALQSGRKVKDTKKSQKTLTNDEIIAIQKKNFASLV